MLSKPRRRSNTGCWMCRSRKVKCNEQHPRCAQCTRLNLVCNWSRGGESIKARRLKLRDLNRTPKAILPAPSETVVMAGDRSPAETAIASSSPTQFDSAELYLESDEWWSSWNVDEEDLPWLILPDAEQALEPSDVVDIYFGSDTNLQCFGTSEPDDLPLHCPRPGSSLARSLCDYHIALPNSMTLSTNEHEALTHYQTTYSLYRSTKDPNWSTHKVLLRLGSQNAMIMHLILAVSINDFYIRKGCYFPSDQAQTHFQIGAQMLIETMQNEWDSDHVSLMAAYFFIYLYMSKRKIVAPQRLARLSLTVLEFVRRHDLDSRCIVSPHSANNSYAFASGTTSDRSILARLIMWTFDEDVKCGFQGSGGHLARHLAAHSARTKDVYEASRNALSNHWGEDYPLAQINDDDQNSTVLEFLWAMMPLWQDINDLPSETDETPSFLNHRIEQTFIALEEKYSSVFRLSSETTKDRVRVLVNADYDVVLFNALRIYHFRSTILNLAIETPPTIRAALRTLVTIIHRTFTSTKPEMLDRLQWPLFLAGIETDDPIYREWILSRLTSSHVAAALQRTLDAQDRSGRRLSMSAIRNLLFDNADLTLSAGRFGFLDTAHRFSPVHSLTVTPAPAFMTTSYQ